MPVLLVLATVVVFLPACAHDFTLYDDPANVFENPAFRPLSWSGVARFWRHPVIHHLSPLTFTFWSFEAWLSGCAAGRAPDPRIFHAGNIILHVLAVLVVFAVLKLLLRKGVPGSGPALAVSAACGALLFAVHPVQVESVAWVTGGKDLLSGLLSLVALWQYLRALAPEPAGRARRFSAGAHSVIASVAFALAVLAKPTAVVVPILAAVLGIGLFRGQSKSGGRPLWRTRAILLPALWLLCVVPWALLTKHTQRSELLRAVAPVWTRPLIFVDTLGFYLYKLTCPFFLGPDYGRAPNRVLAHAGTSLVPAALVVLGFVLLVRAWPASRRWACLAAALFVAGLLPVSGLTAFAFQVFSTPTDRYLYVAMLGPALACAALPACRRGRVVRTSVVLLCLFYGVRSAVQTRHWHNTETLARNALAVNPASTLAHNLMGDAQRARGEFAAAVSQYSAALRLDPHYREVHNDIGLALERLGKSEQALFHYSEAARLSGPIAGSYKNLGRLLQARGRPLESIASYSEALKRDPWDPYTHNNIGNVLRTQDRVEESIRHYRIALRLAPDLAKTHTNLGMAYGRLRQLAAAATHFSRALALDPTIEEARRGLDLVRRLRAEQPATGP